MKFTRRKALASIGIATVGTGAVFSTGAFTRTEVDRDFDMTIAQDSNALLALEATGNTDAVQQTSDGTLGFDFANFHGSGNVQGDGLNFQGDTAFSDAFTITNQTANPVWVWIPTFDKRMVDNQNSFQTALYNFLTRSVEVTASEADANAANWDPNLGSRPDPIGPDLTFPGGLPKNPNNEPAVDDANNITLAFNKADVSRAFGMTPGGSVRLDPGTTVSAGLNIMINPPSGVGLTPPVTISDVIANLPGGSLPFNPDTLADMVVNLRFAASQTAPTTDTTAFTSDWFSLVPAIDEADLPDIS